MNFKKINKLTVLLSLLSKISLRIEVLCLDKVNFDKTKYLEEDFCQN